MSELTFELKIYLLYHVLLAKAEEKLKNRKYCITPLSQILQAETFFIDAEVNVVLPFRNSSITHMISRLLSIF